METEKKLWYLGDPCYVIADEEWKEFCQLTFAHQTKDEHLDSIIDWKGVELEIWRCGGDGTWGFTNVGDGCLNGDITTWTFGVDAGIFTVMPFELVEKMDMDRIKRLGLVFDKKPTLHVEDYVVFVNGNPDDQHQQCWTCKQYVPNDQFMLDNCVSCGEDE